MKNRLICAILMVALIAAVALSACAAPTPTTSPTTTTAPTTTAAPPKVIELIYNDTTPAQVPKCQHTQAWAKKIEDFSKGRVKFTFYWSNSLIPQPDIIKGVAQGVADISYLPFNVNLTPLNYEIMYLPFMGYTSMEMGTKVWDQLYAKFPVLKEEFTKPGVKLLNANLMPPQQMHFTKKAVKTPADMKGMKIIASGKQADLVSAAGGSPVELGNIMEMYTSLERGMVEGVVNHYPVMVVFGAMPVVPYHTNFGKGGISMGLHGLIMNPKTYDSLPADIQKYIDELNPWYIEEMLKIDNAEIERGMGIGREAKHTFIDLTPAEIEPWAKLGKPLQEAWVKEMEAKGLPGRALYDEAIKLIAQSK